MSESKFKHKKLTTKKIFTSNTKNTSDFVFRSEIIMSIYVSLVVMFCFVSDYIKTAKKYRSHCIWPIIIMFWGMYHRNKSNLCSKVSLNSVYSIKHVNLVFNHLLSQVPSIINLHIIICCDLVTPLGLGLVWTFC